MVAVYVYVLETEPKVAGDTHAILHFAFALLFASTVYYSISRFRTTIE